VTQLPQLPCHTGQQLTAIGNAQLCHLLLQWPVLTTLLMSLTLINRSNV
jgi:hypothetical protein